MLSMAVQLTHLSVKKYITPMSVKRKNLVITGASSGIGRSFLELSAPHFDAMYTLGRTQPSLEMGHIVHHSLDLRERVRPQLDEMKIPKHIDALVLCAGADEGGRKGFLENPFSTWENTIQINFLQTLELVHCLLPRVLESDIKTILAVTSSNIDNPPQGCLAYTSAKTALRSALETLRLEFSSKNLRVIEICPGITKSNFALNRSGQPEVAESFYQSFQFTMDPKNVAQSMLWALQQDPRYSISRLEIEPTVCAR